MSMRYKGAIRSSTAPTTSSSSAVGIWTIRQQLQAIGGTGWVNPYKAWIGLLGGASSDSGNSIAIDSSGNIYVCGYADSGTSVIQLAKYNNFGVIQWQKSLGDANNNYGYSISIDSSNNVYVLGYRTTTNIVILLAKYDVNGTIQWQRSLGNASSATYQYGWNVTTDASGNIYLCGSTDDGGTRDWQIAKYDSSGSVLWQRRFGGTVDNERALNITIDSSGNVIICGENKSDLGRYTFETIKYDSSGALQWQRRLDGGGTSTSVAYGVKTDSSNNIYVSGYSNASGSTQGFIAKYDTSGTLQWQKSLSGAGTTYIASMTIDSSNNFYITGYSTASGGFDVLIAKYDSSGNIQWQRTLGNSSSTDYGSTIVMDNIGNLYICGVSSVSGTYDFLIVKLPTNGALTGTYTVGGYSFTYGASSLTSATSSFTAATSSLSSNVSTLTNSTTSLTSNTTALTSSVTSL